MTPHPDEGTLHAFIDGELPEIEVAALELHVAGCALCAAALAEARGFVAGASRAITALDAAPASAGTVPPAVSVSAPPAPPRKVRSPIFRAPYARAAALLLLAGGTAVVFDHAGPRDEASATTAETFVTDVATKEAPAAATAATPMTAPVAAPTTEASRPAPTTTGRARSTKGAAGAGVSGYATVQEAVAPSRVAAGVSNEASVAAPAAPPAIAPTMPPRLAQAAEEIDMSGATASTATRPTRFRTKEGVVLTLTEEPLRASSGEATSRRRDAVQMAAPASAPAINSYRWSSAEQRKSFTLSGQLSVAELEAAAKRLSELERVP